MFLPTYDDDDELPETWLPCGSSNLTFSCVYEPMFFSAVWFVEARLNDKRIFKSKEYDKSISQGELRQWARALMRNKQQLFKRNGVDLDKTYVSHGGEISDFKD